VTAQGDPSRKPRHGEEGQVVVLFALMAVAIVGLIALALDFGMLVDHHRKLQAYVDHAAVAGSYQLAASPTSAQRQEARRRAYIALRDNLGYTTSGSQFSSQAGACSFATDVVDCPFPAPNDHDKVSIYSPAQFSVGQLQPPDAATVSVSISQDVGTSFMAALGIKSASTSASGSAQLRVAQNADFAMYLDGCLNVGNTPLMSGGDVYINQCTINMLSQNSAALCIQSTPNKAGNLIFGPLASTPGGNQAGNKNLGQCQGIGGDNILAMGGISSNPSSIPPPVFNPPPNVPACPVSGCGAATANHPCKNHTVGASGATVSNCYDPGAYTTIGASGSPGSTTGPIANNLNPGVYLVTGDTSSGCYANSGAASCPGVFFGGNTMNANFADVAGTCWASPNNPGAPTTPTPQTLFTAPCPSGFALNPQTTSDPQISGCSVGAVTAPTFSLANVATGGTLAAGAFYVRVTALNALGESVSSAEQSITVPTGTVGQNAIDVTINTQASATGGYVVYGPSPAPNQEVAYPGSGGARPYPALATVAQPAGPPATVKVTVTNTPSGTAPWPRFDTNSCTGFHNINRNPYENNGVTFVLNGKASICLTPGCATASGDPTPTVLLSPYCSTLSNTDLPPAAGVSPCPYAIDGPNLNDGAYILYGNTQGLIQASGTGTRWAMTGTLYTPKATLALGTLTGGSSSDPPVFSLMPGQIIAKSASIYTANGLLPFVYYDLVGAGLPGYVQLVR
jgi:Flp pilus assembly protein TadG